MDKKNQKNEWFNARQNHNLGYKLMFFLLKAVPSPLMRFLAFPVGFFYWLFGKSTRRVSADYLKRVRSFSREQVKVKSSFLHIVSFALNLVENVQSWAGKYSFNDVHWQDDDVTDLVNNINAGKGTLILISHLGNAQMMKGLASLGESGTERKMSITTISDANISAGFNALLNQVNPDSSFHIVNSNNIGPETVFLLQERLEKGEVVVIAGDRISAHTDRNIQNDFLGAPASLPYGVFLLVALLNVPAYFVNGLRHYDFGIRSHYDMYVAKNPVDFNCGRKEREERIRKTSEEYVKNLEKLCLKHPYQWYNFFDFWL